MGLLDQLAVPARRERRASVLTASVSEHAHDAATQGVLIGLPPRIDRRKHVTGSLGASLGLQSGVSPSRFVGGRSPAFRVAGLARRCIA